jgi:thioredoxin-like negative regulator of GroEL
MTECICLTGFIFILVVIIVVVRRRRSKDSKTDSADLADKANSAPSLSGIERVPDIKMPSDPKSALAQGKHLLVQGRRAEAVALLIHALREGSSDVSQEASRTLEELGEIEVF